VIIYDLDGVRIIVLPLKDNMPLSVNAEAPEAAEIIRQFLKTVSGGNPENFEGRRGVDLIKQSLSFGVEGRRKFSRMPALSAVINIPGEFVSETFYHKNYIIYRYIIQ
jgi:hypothetical protein